jgi:hypothetical protein
MPWEKSPFWTRLVAGIDGGDGGAEEVGVAGPQEERQVTRQRAASRRFMGAVSLTYRGEVETDKSALRARRSTRRVTVNPRVAIASPAEFEARLLLKRFRKKDLL